MIPLDPGDRRVDLAEGIPGQAGREQHRALVDEQIRYEDPQLVELALGVIEMSERGGQVTTGVCRHSAFLTGGRIFRLLTAFGVQPLGPCVVAVSSLAITHREVHRRSPDHRAGFPHQVAGPGQQPHGGLGVPQGISVAAQDPEGANPAYQDPASGNAWTAAPHRIIEDRQAALGLAGQDQGHAQARGDIRFAVQVPGPAREPTCLSEFFDSLPYIAEILEDHAGRLVRDCGLKRGRMAGQQLASDGEGLRWARQRQGEQFVRLPGTRAGVRDGRHLTNRN